MSISSAVKSWTLPLDAVKGPPYGSRRKIRTYMHLWNNEVVPSSTGPLIHKHDILGVLLDVSWLSGMKARRYLFRNVKVFLFGHIAENTGPLRPSNATARTTDHMLGVEESNQQTGCCVNTPRHLRTLVEGTTNIPCVSKVYTEPILILPLFE